MPRSLLLLLIVLLLSPPSWAAVVQEGSAEASRITETSGSEGAGFEEKVDEVFGILVAKIGAVLMYDVSRLFGRTDDVRFIVLWLLIGGVFLTFRMGFINLRAFGHAIAVTRGRYDNPADQGEVTHFQALASALSATVGLGNIAGVAIAVAQGGPGAVFWLVVAGFFGMTMKFTECTLGQMYRHVDARGNISGGAMRYLALGLKERGLGGVGKFLAVLFSVLCVLASFGGGNAFQVNQALGVVGEQVSFFGRNNWAFGVVMAVAVGIVIIGGIRRIAATAEKIVPLMCGIYLLACFYIFFRHPTHILPAFETILSEAFTPRAGYGGFIGVMMIGIRRAVFSNEAGVGSAAIAHSAARTEEPIREGIVALLEPFIDTIVVCTMTGLVIVITGAYDPVQFPGNAELISGDNGAALTSAAFASVISWFPYVLCVAVILFAYSTMISWSYYGERCFTQLFGAGSSLVYKLLFITFTFLGSIVTATNVLDFSDLMILAMAFPNLIGLYVMSGKVHAAMRLYMGKLESSEFKVYK